MVSFLPPDPALERRILQIGSTLLARVDAAPAHGIFSRKGAYARLMEWSLKDPAFKTQLFRFVDVLPALRSNAEIVRHLQDYLGDRAVELNPAMKAGLAASSLAPALVAGPVKANLTAMARQFVAGETPADLLQRLHHNARQGIATTIDLLGEAVVSNDEADTFGRRNIDVLDTVSAALAREPGPCFSDLGPTGPLPRLNLSVKISGLSPEVQPADPEGALIVLKHRLRPILRRAAEVGAFINFDMESYRWKDLTLALFKSILEEPEFVGRLSPSQPDAQRAAPDALQATVGIALQAYLRDAERDLRDLIDWARQRRFPIGVRLVKGAYWDYETVLAQQRGWPRPVWSEKAESDATFELLSLILLENCDLIAPAFATHNVRSCAHAIAQAERLQVNPRTFEFQALYGMADELKTALIGEGYRVREYCAIGELLPGMAYLVRRLLENTSNESFLRRQNNGEATKEELLVNPVSLLASHHADPSAPARPIPPRSKPGDVPSANDRPAHREALSEFSNAPITDFSKEENRLRQRAALADARANLGRRWPLVINGRRRLGRTVVPSINPAHPAEIVGHWSRATLEDADAALATARAAFPGWSTTSVDTRARVLERAADLMETRRFDLNALEILEAGKPWLEADADVSEAIDFCRYYAAEMRRLDQPQRTQVVAGERCVQHWIPRGTGVVIAPWNFPLAILCGLTVAPVVAGNTVIMKPAEQTSVLAAMLMDIFIEAGAPPGVINLLTGHGEDVGAHLVAHPDVDFVAFTGSRAVGLKIWETAGRTLPGQRNLKKVVCEMGGKNALIIDADADFDEAIPAALYSAFGFSGQKCSALSRLIVLAEIHEDFVKRLLAAAAALPLGDPWLPGSVIGPVIDADAREKILAMIEQGKRDAVLAWQATVSLELKASGGFYVPPTIFTHVPPEATLAREEIFGPVLAVMKVPDLDAAIALANATDYALTAGIFSRSPRALHRAERELQAGNIYLNRGITGAIVERHPFGGYKMSGGGTKAGGRGYLDNFLFPRVIAENVLRRGFTPVETGE